MKITEFLEDNGIEFWTTGKNVPKGCINIQCVFCDDNSNHLWINRKSLKVSCWRCGNHRLVNLIMEITGQPFRSSKQIENSLTLGVGEYGVPPFQESTASSILSTSVTLPRESKKVFPEKHIRYLENRGFKASEIIRKYKLRAVHTVGKYKFRIIIPIILDRKIVSFTSRDITDQQEPKYRHASPSESAMSPKRLIYNSDTLTTGSDAILVEGPTDVWKLGNNTVSLLGLKYTEDQIIILMNKKIRNLFILFDNDKPGKKEARKIAKVLSPLVKRVEIITLETASDPGSLKTEEAKIIKRELGFDK